MLLLTRACLRSRRLVNTLFRPMVSCHWRLRFVWCSSVGFLRRIQSGSWQVCRSSCVALMSCPQQEKASLFQRFVQLNAAVVAYIFSVSATWIIISATRHQTATDSCVQDFFAANATTVDQAGVFSDDGQGPTICNIFTWVSVGIMGGLWLIMLIFQVSRAIKLYLQFADLLA